MDTESVEPGFACDEDDDWTMHHESPRRDSGANKLLVPKAGQSFGLLGRRIMCTMVCVAACSSRRAREGKRDQRDQHER